MIGKALRTIEKKASDINRHSSLTEICSAFRCDLQYVFAIAFQDSPTSNHFFYMRKAFETTSSFTKRPGIHLRCTKEVLQLFAFKCLELTTE